MTKYLLLIGALALTKVDSSAYWRDYIPFKFNRTPPTKKEHPAERLNIIPDVQKRPVLPQKNINESVPSEKDINELWEEYVTNVQLYRKGNFVYPNREGVQLLANISEIADKIKNRAGYRDFIRTKVRELEESIKRVNSLDVMERIEHMEKTNGDELLVHQIKENNFASIF